MKKIFPLISLLLLVVACTAEIDNQFGSRAGAPRDKAVFQASVEECTAPDTKVYADENMKVLWNADDRISIFNMTTGNAQYAFTGDDGDTAGGFEWVSESESDTAIDHVYAVYPYQVGTTVGTDGVISTTFPAEQPYKIHSFGVGANTMVAVTDESFLAFKNVGGYLSLRFYGDDISVRRIMIRGNNGEKISGKGSIVMPFGGMPTVTMDEDATDVVSIVCDPAVKLGSSAESYTDFWFVIPPVTFTGGFKITVIDDQGGVFTKSTSKSFTVSRNTLDWMNALKVVPDYDNENIEFEDDNFKAYCVANFDYNNDGEISEVEVADEKTIDVCTDEIRSIKGVEFFASLENLTCKGSKIGTKGSDDAYAGQLESIDVSKNVHLKKLDCSGNPNLQEVILAPDQVIATLEIPVVSNVVYAWEEAALPDPDEIWYTSSDRSVVSPTSDKFGTVTIVSNTYVDGKGVIKFSGPLITIGRNAFKTARKLTSITLPEGLETIDDEAFKACQALVSITFPSTLDVLGNHAMQACTSLAYVTLPDMTRIGHGPFSQCYIKAFQGTYASEDHNFLVKDGKLIATTFLPAASLPELPSYVTSIGESVFQYWEFTELTIPEGVNEIWSYAFGDCRSLTSVTIPEHVNYVAFNSFNGCSALREFKGKFASEDHRFLVGDDGATKAFAPAGLTSCTVPSNVTKLSPGTFDHCGGLLSITVPASVLEIDVAAIYECNGLTSLIFESLTPPTLGSSGRCFDSTNNCPIYVPASAVDTYKETEGWSRHADRIFSIMELTNLWRWATVTTTQFFSISDWSGGLTADVTMLDGNGFEITIPEGIGGSQWMGQLYLHTDIQLLASKEYDFSCKVTSTAASPFVIKLSNDPEADSKVSFYDASVEMIAGTVTVRKEKIKPETEDAEAAMLIFDFGRTPAGTKVTVTDIDLREHIYGVGI
ncbi:MAG: leucine-rich repeat protein [Bacteroidales bacterium]|nr:leucine-rich repeat protein [Bacteroidales bacterium]